MDNGVALITGGASGIGFAVAAQLGRAGYTVVVLGRNTESGRQAATALCASGIDAVGDGADFSNHAEVASLRERLGRGRTRNFGVLGRSHEREDVQTLRTAPDEWDRCSG